MYPNLFLGKKKKADHRTAFALMNAFSSSTLINRFVVYSDDSPVSHLALALSAPMAEPAAGSDCMLLRDAVAHVAASLTLDHLAAQDIFVLREASVKYGGSGAVDMPREQWYTHTATEAARVSELAADKFDMLLSCPDDLADEITAHGRYSIQRGDDGCLLASFSSPTDAPIGTLSQRLPCTQKTFGQTIDPVISLPRVEQKTPVCVFVDNTNHMTVTREHVPLLLLARVTVAVAIAAISQQGVGIGATTDDVARAGRFLADTFSLIQVYSSLSTVPTPVRLCYIVPDHVPEPSTPTVEASSVFDGLGDKDPLASLLDWE
jgi:hypothetical protein